jgi:uncharacterized protein (DUF697 family)
MHDLDRTLRSQEPELEGDFEYAIFGEAENEFEFEAESYELTEEQEIDLAAELLAVSDDRELDQFLGGLLKKAKGAVGPMLKKYLKPLAKKLIPIAATAAGGFFGGPIGAKIGGQVGNFATKLFEVDFESMDGEVDMEVARSFVRLANAAATNAATAGPTADPTKAAKTALVQAAKTYAPGLVRKPSSGGIGSVTPSVISRRKSGRWIRRQGRIVLLGV